MVSATWKASFGDWPDGTNWGRAHGTDCAVTRDLPRPVRRHRRSPHLPPADFPHEMAYEPAGRGGVVSVRRLRNRSDVEPPSSGAELSLYELAFLAGGEWRVAETALLRMVLANRLEMDRNGMLRVIRPRPRDEVEAVLLAAIGPSGTAWFGRPRSAFGASAPAAELEDALRRRGLLVGGASASGGPGTRGASGARRSLRVLTRLTVPVLITVALTAVAVLTCRAAVLLGVDPGVAVILGGIAPLLVAAGAGRRPQQRRVGGGGRRPCARGRSE
ncbi:TIGR04222 domain-containing membrane protein, partial [Kitasatospora sp. NPDC047058]|uniref:TIGR04222 domain-containing membrane protein n=1 Tax=Kitasatospora sp. NPDC047058 TaxID=3155620 RepID=UPI0033CD55A8